MYLKNKQGFCNDNTISYELEMSKNYLIYSFGRNEICGDSLLKNNGRYN